MVMGFKAPSLASSMLASTAGRCFRLDFKHADRTHRRAFALHAAAGHLAVTCKSTRTRHTSND
eukprot:644295-Amphidinium_carterae.2